MLTQAGAKRIKCCRLVHMYLVWGSVIRVRRLNGGVSAESARGGNLPGFHSLPGTGPCPQYTHPCQDLRSPRTFLIVPQFHEIAFHLKRSARNRQPSHFLIKARKTASSFDHYCFEQKIFGSSQNFYLRFASPLLLKLKLDQIFLQNWLTISNKSNPSALLGVCTSYR